MSVVLLEAGALIVLAKYIFKKKNSKVWYFRRRIPEDVLGHYPSKQAKDLVFSLQTTDEGKAAGLAHKKATEQDALWHSFRTGEVAEGPDLVNVALAILSKFGLKPDQSKAYAKHDLEPDEFLDELRYQADAREPEGNQKDWGARLPSEYQLAAEMYYGKKKPIFLSEALKEFLELKGESPDHGAGRDRNRVVSEFISKFSDLPIDQYSRETANEFVTHLRSKGNKTETIKRRINSIRPIFRTISREHALIDREIFQAIQIPSFGDDAKARLPYTLSELNMIQKECLAKDDDIKWIIALLSDSGIRLSEATGLMTEDVYLDADVPYIAVRPNEARGLKTKGSNRNVPLVGASLWALERALPHSEYGYIFPRYIDASKSSKVNKGTHASNTLAKWLRTLDIEDKSQKATHSFRHSVQDRLREVQTPEEVRNAICGWSNAGIGAGYGKGFSLTVLSEHMEKIVLRDWGPHL
ncbi:DUF6538 domain-containing protein [Sulfitobacter geojensis]|uniref:DUF6538 domain-containing protein n=1 Tax=Sulfitobacter geojensis TaxID=1342299 RepID=UPI00046A94BC|nr:DUF6538 domain-containing protein [Sulfitobacter geojensis]KHA51989.1 phage integrase [Sulfitobacter geojensis]NYI29395.1 integrase [Sulfitobacter geojensis]